MKNKMIITMVVFIASGIIHASAQNKPANITGYISMPEPIKWIYLRHAPGESWVTDSAAVVNGRFNFRVSVPEVSEAYIYTKKKTMGTASIYLEPGNITVRIINSMRQLDVEGSAAHASFVSLNKMLAPFEERQSLLRKKMGEQSDVEAKKQLRLEWDLLAEDINKIVYQAYIAREPESPIIADVLTKTIVSWYAPKLENLERAEALYKGLPEHVKKRPSVKEFNRRLNAALSTTVGRMAMDFKLPDTAGKTVSLSSFRGKYVLLDFWASWCVPCRANNPNLIKAYNEFKDKNFTVLGIAFDKTNYKVWMDAIHTDKLPWINLIDTAYPDNASVGKMYNVGSIPQNVLVDPTGKIIAKNIEGKELEKKLTELLN